MRYTLALHERCFSITDSEGGHARAPKHAPRGAVRGISRRSRRRLIVYLAKVSRSDEAVFITLTYRDFVDDFEVWKSHLHVFKIWFRYHYPEFCGFWRLEFQERGAPHFHLLLWLGVVADVDRLRHECKEAWCRIIGQSSPANYEHGCKVERVVDFRESAFYISVYQAKDTQDRTDIDTGREWGMWGKERLGLEPIKTLQLGRKSFTLLRRIVRRSYVSYVRRNPSVWGPKGERYLRALRTDQPFSNFLPFGTAVMLAHWCADPRNSGDVNPF